MGFIGYILIVLLMGLVYASEIKIILRYKKISIITITRLNLCPGTVTNAHIKGQITQTFENNKTATNSIRVFYINKILKHFKNQIMKKTCYPFESGIAVSILMAQNAANTNSRQLPTLRLAEHPDNRTARGIIYYKKNIFYQLKF